MIAMTGKNCVAIASDTRFGIDAQTIAFDFSKVWQISDKLFVGLPGLLTDSQTLYPTHSLFSPWCLVLLHSL